MADFVDYNFDDLREKIQNKLKDREGWGDAYESTVGQVLIDINAEAADILSYMLERRSQENHISTARLRSSVIVNASDSGYRLRRSIASNGTLTMKLVDSEGNPKPVESGGDVFIEENETVTFNGESFITTDSIEIDEGESEATVPVSQGTYESITVDPTTDETFLSDRYVLIPSYEDIAEDSISVVVDGVAYTDVRDVDESRNIGTLSLSEKTSVGNPATGAYYDIRYSHDGMRIQFGDGVFGRLPTSPIQINFIRTKGSSIRVLSLNNEFQFDFNVVTDGLNVTPRNEYNYELTNTTTIVNGRDAESIDDIRLNAPLSNLINERAVNVTGYNFWAKRSGIGGIIDANTFTEKELQTLMYNLNNIYISYLTESGNALDNTQKQNFIDFMKERDVSLAHIVPIKADEIQLGIIVDFKRNASVPIPNSQAYQIIKDFMEEFFVRKEGSIGNTVHKSDLIRDFYDLTVKAEGITYNLTDFVDLTIHAYQPFTVPIQTNFSTLYVDPSIEGNVSAGDTFSIIIDGTTISVTVESGDLGAGVELNLSNKMRDEVIAQTNLKAEVVNLDEGGSGVYVVNISTSDDFGTFTIDGNAGDISTYVDIIKRFQINPKTLTTDGLEEDIIEAGSISILDSNDDLVYQDDGTGGWLDSNGDPVSMSSFFGTTSEDPISYADAVVYFPPGIADGDYNIKYRQDQYENFSANDAAAVTLISPKDDFEDTVETFTEIRFV